MGGLRMRKHCNFLKSKMCMVDWHIWGIILFGSLLLGVFGSAFLGVSWFAMMAFANVYIFR